MTQFPCRPGSLLSALLGVLLLAGPAAAESGSDDLPAARAFDQLDRDGDGAITRAEFALARDSEFTRLDADRDGFISRAEFVDRRLPRSDLPSARVEDLRRTLLARFAALDANGDGRISQAEYTANGRLLFQRLDRDGDGRITRAEFLDPTGAAAKPTDPGARIFGLLDRNGDGVITRDEMDAARKAAFERLDANHDGYLDEEEFAARNPDPGAPIAPPEIESRQKHDPRFIQLDRNGDGRISLEEYLADGHDRFARADRNRDGKLTREEFDALDQ
jgi:Ca2+-binding EF-hand superfamily protein